VALALVLDSGLEPTHVGGLTMGADPVGVRDFMGGS